MWISRRAPQGRHLAWAGIAAITATLTAAVWAAPGEVVFESQVGLNTGGFFGDLEADSFGSGVISLGDLDGDGADDLAVGAWKARGLGFARGSVWILFLDPNNPGLVNGWL